MPTLYYSYSAGGFLCIHTHAYLYPYADAEACFSIAYHMRIANFGYFLSILHQ